MQLLIIIIIIIIIIIKLIIDHGIKRMRSRDSSVSVVIRLRAGRPWNRGDWGPSSPKHPEPLWNSPSLPFTGYRRLFRRRQSGRGLELITDLYQALRLRMNLPCHVQALISRSFIAEAQGQYHASLCGICVKQSSTGTGFSRSTLVSFCHHSSSAPASVFHLSPTAYGRTN